MPETYPITEFDPTREAMTEPTRLCQRRNVPAHCVICFFHKVVDEVIAEHSARVVVENRWEDGPHNLYEIEHQGQRLAFFQPGVGAPLAAGLLEEAIAYGCNRFVVCGGAGVLRKDIAVGHLIVVSSAVRDEGTSYHYLPPAREVEADPSVVATMTAALDQRRLPYLVAKTWTTDAPYRETRPTVDRRRAEGCVTVEMESAAFLAVARFRGVKLGQILYGGDDLSGAEWDERAWYTRDDVRRNLFWLAADTCLQL
jgi:uridine phosphorylase